MEFVNLSGGTTELMAEIYFLTRDGSSNPDSNEDSKAPAKVDREHAAIFFFTNREGKGSIGKPQQKSGLFTLAPLFLTQVLFSLKC